MAIAEQVLTDSYLAIGATVAPPRARSQAAWVAAWFVCGLLGRGVLATHIEGLFDHDQAVVGLMALDIAEGRRLPIYFDGQRYMGAIEAYVAAPFVRVFGLRPFTVTLAPLLFCGAFVAGQFWVWSRWRDRATGHGAALVTLICSPMAAVWTMIPRGGYVEFLCWALGVLYVYSRVCRAGAPALGGLAQFGWGLLLGIGFFINPLSAVVYATIFVDWTFGRYGRWLRRRRSLDTGPIGRWLDGRGAVAVWGASCLMMYALLTFGMFVRLHEGARFVALWGLAPSSWGVGAGAVTVGLVLVGGAIWTGAAQRVVAMLASHRAFALGLAASLLPFVIFQLRSRLGLEPAHASLPMWLRDPATVWQNARDLVRAAPALLGCDARGLALMYERWPERFPTASLPMLGHGLAIAAIPCVALVVALCTSVAWGDRHAWREWLALRCADVATPSMIALLGVFMSVALYLVQSTSPDGSSSRYLMPVWVFLPGLLATGAMRLHRAGRWMLGVLVIAWGVAQGNLWSDMARENPIRGLAKELDRRNVPVIVAPQHVGLVVTELTSGRVGAFEYRPYWKRLHDRYRSRFRSDLPIVCVAESENRGLPQEDLAVRMRAASREGSARLVETVDGYEIWETSLPLDAVCPKGRMVQATE